LNTKQLLEEFHEDAGEGSNRIDVPESVIEKWDKVLPNSLLDFWKSDGWASYFDGLVTFVNPDDYHDVLEEWIKGTPLAAVDRFHVFAMNAFGYLYLCGEKSGLAATINCPLNFIVALENDFQKPKFEPALSESFEAFLFDEKEDFDFLDGEGTGMYDLAMETCGPLGLGEIYGFEPAIVAGGQVDVHNLAKVKAIQHLLILRELANPSCPTWNVRA